MRRMTKLAGVVAGLSLVGSLVGVGMAEAAPAAPPGANRINIFDGTSGTLANGVKWTASTNPHALRDGTTLAFGFDRAVTADIIVTNINVTDECVTLPAGVAPVTIDPNHRFDAAENRICNKVPGYTDEDYYGHPSTFRLANTTGFTTTGSSAGAGGGERYVSVQLPDSPPASGNCLCEIIGGLPLLGNAGAPAPGNLAPVSPAPGNLAPVNPAPGDVAPVNPAPADPGDTAPADPGDSAPADPGTGDQPGGDKG